MFDSSHFDPHNADLAPLTALYELYETDLGKRPPFKGSGAPAPCLAAMSAKANAIIKDYTELPELPFNASVGTWIAVDGLSAWCMLFPPLGGGDELDEAGLKKALLAADIKIGIDEQLLQYIVSDKDYFRPVQIAEGFPAENGVDGRVEPLLEINDAPGPVQDEFGKVDFKELGLVQNVKAGDKLCSIVLPTPGRDGCTVKGHRLHAKPGKPAPYIGGENTEYTEDGLLLIASVDGRLIKKGIKFAVTQTMTIAGNVDYSTGNIDANCSVIVMGDVLPDFKVVSTRDIIIYGTVEGAILEAGGGICVYGGVLASNKGQITCGGDLKCKFMEYGNATVGGNAYFENLIHSNVQCDGDIMVISGRGIVIGGKLTAMGNISITVAGNRANCPTELRIWPTDRFMEHSKAMRQEEEIYAARCNRITEALDKLRQLPPGTADDKIKQLESTLPIERIRFQRAENAMQEVRTKVEDMEKHRITLNRSFPKVSVHISNDGCVIEEETGSTVYYYRDGGIKSAYHSSEKHYR